MTNKTMKITVYALFLSSFLYVLLAYSNFKNSQNSYINSIVHNWSLGPISQIEALKGECPPGQTSLLSNSWEGTFPGCYCGGGLVADLKDGSCTDQNGCSDVLALNPVKYKFWKGFNLCTKRGLNYLELKTAKAPNACGANFKACGVIDLLGNFLCYPEKEQCPYNYVKFINLNKTEINFIDYKESKNQENNKENEKAKENYFVEILLESEKGNEGKLVFGYDENLTNAKIIN
jgi:hypothetical protein